MRDMTKSVMSLPWAMTLLAAERAIQGASPRRAEQSLYAVRQTAVLELNDVLWAAYQVGDQLQREFIDWVFRSLKLEAFKPESVRRLTMDVAWQSAETVRALTPGSGLELSWLQLKNNYEVYNLVKQVRSLLRIPDQPDLDLAPLVERAYALGEYADLWAVEGLGHDYADHAWSANRPLRDLLTGKRASELPDKSLTMMHAGMGLCFAQRLMPRLTPYSPASQIDDTLRTFIRLSRENSRPGYTGAAYESLGLVTRTWHPEMVRPVDECLCALVPEIVPFFWHGAGRALYFLPVYFVPGGPSPWLVADREAPHDTGRRNQRAGLAWATTLVNLRQPRIMEQLIHRHGCNLASDDAFANGVASSLVMAWDTTPGDSYIEKFAEYRSGERGWDQLVGQPCRRAIDRYHPVLQKRGRLEEVFHYGALDDLADRLEGGL